jgi:hypothetical protein
MFPGEYYSKLHLPLLSSHRYPIGVFWKLRGLSSETLKTDSHLSLDLPVMFKIDFRSIQQSWNRAEPLVKTNRPILCGAFSIHHNSIFQKTSQNQCPSIVACGLKSWQRSASKCDQSDLTLSQNITDFQKRWHFITLPKYTAQFKCLKLWNGA